MTRPRCTVFGLARQLSNIVRGYCTMVYIKVVSFAVLGLYLSWYLNWPCLLVCAVVLGVYLATGGWRFARVVIKTLPRDFRALVMLAEMKWKVRNYSKNGLGIPDLFVETAKKYPSKACFLFEDLKWTFQDVDLSSNAIANFFHDSGIRQGDVVALFMENRPEFVIFWLGLAKIGAVAALINYNLRGRSLAHCINASEAKVLIFTAEFSEAVAEIAVSLPSDTKLYTTAGKPEAGISATAIDPLVAKSPTFPPPQPKIKFTGKLFYVYTSGTTDLPKAAIISHSRFFYMTNAVNRLLRINADDVLYTVLPLYHTAGGVVGVGQTFLNGTTMVVKKKFSASRFWEDCIRYNCTASQYIGEICRYLLAQPPKPTDKQHKVKLMFGNGLRPQIWSEFQQRFGVEIMGEFYGATEGNCNILNFENAVGAVGFTSMIAPFMYPVTLIKVDKETGTLVRDRNGVCVKAKPGEPGELVGRITRGDPMREFDGYVNKQASDKKVAIDVFSKGDMAFLTGDVLVMDEYGYMQFRDRTGDTFRWKGENVSTSEVEGTISIVVKHKDAVVYGVEVPGAEGRAGMAAIVDPDEMLDLQALLEGVKKALPAYARPLFIRLIKEVDSTGTFKLKKTVLREEAYDPMKVNDKLFYLCAKTSQYQPITSSVYTDILNGKIRF